jgi:hypothetical protein
MTKKTIIIILTGLILVSATTLIVLGKFNKSTDQVNKDKDTEVVENIEGKWQDSNNDGINEIPVSEGGLQPSISDPSFKEDVVEGAPITDAPKMELDKRLSEDPWSKLLPYFTNQYTIYYLSKGSVEISIPQKYINQRDSIKNNALEWLREQGADTSKLRLTNSIRGY